MTDHLKLEQNEILLKCALDKNGEHMKVGNSMVVEVDFVLKNDEGEVIDSSEGRDPMIYLHGAQNIVEGLEDALDELEVDDEFEVVVPPKLGYGERDRRFLGEVPKDKFPKDSEIEVGMRYITDTPDGQRSILITEVKEDTVMVDGNHELAGKNLHFSGKVVSIREATEIECHRGFVQSEHSDHHHH